MNVPLAVWKEAFLMEKGQKCTHKGKKAVQTTSYAKIKVMHLHISLETAGSRSPHGFEELHGGSCSLRCGWNDGKNTILSTSKIIWKVYQAYWNVKQT